MCKRIDRYWRVVATACCFMVFGLGGVLVSTTVYPAICLVYRDRTRRSLATKSCIHHAFRCFIGLMVFLRVLTYEVRGVERLKRNGLLIVANHPSLIDVIFLISRIQRADCIVKSELAKNPFTRGPIEAAGYICNDTGAGMVDDCIASLRGGNNLVIFPEGTRTPLKGTAKLQRGAANIAVRGAIDITPVHIRSSLPMLSKGVKWYRVPAHRVHFIIDVQEDIPVQKFLSECSNQALAARRLTNFIANHFHLDTHYAKS